MLEKWHIKCQLLPALQLRYFQCGTVALKADHSKGKTSHPAFLFSHRLAYGKGSPHCVPRAVTVILCARKAACCGALLVQGRRLSSGHRGHSCRYSRALGCSHLWNLPWWHCSKLQDGQHTGGRLLPCTINRETEKLKISWASHRMFSWSVILISRNKHFWTTHLPKLRSWAGCQDWRLWYEFPSQSLDLTSPRS